VARWYTVQLLAANVGCFTPREGGVAFDRIFVVRPGFAIESEIFTWVTFVAH